MSGVVVADREAMHALGRQLAGLLRAGDLVVLSGPLGAGKTTLAQGIGVGLQVRGPITSPTFVLARVHPSLVGGPALVHVDAYRLGTAAEVDGLDLDASLATAVTLVEWGEGKVEELAPARLEIRIERATGAAVAAGDVAARTVADETDETDEADEADEPRVVAVTGVGKRWVGVALPGHDLRRR